MKKILLSLMVLGGLVTSCNMDLEPIGSILDEVSVESATDCENFRNAFYGNIRALSTGGYIYYTEMQMDMFNGTVMNGNRVGSLSNGVILSGDGDIESIWGGLFGAVANTNYLFPRAQMLLDDPETSTTDRELIKRYVAEGHFARAYYYYWLLDHFCPSYSSENANELVGLPLVTEYYPTAEKQYYPGRATLAETYKFIEDDLAAAYDGIKFFEENFEDIAVADAREEEKSAAQEDARNQISLMLTQNAPYLSSWAVRALQARVALLKGDNQTAAKYAEEVINCGIWQLDATGLLASNSYTRLWTTDAGKELIFRPISSAGELGISSTGGGWIAVAETQADYIPTSYVINELYGGRNSKDGRRAAFLRTQSLLYEGRLVDDVYCFSKFPGNPDLNSNPENPLLLNMAKPFRLSEMYLIAAEAYQVLGNEENANKYLNDIRKARIRQYQETSYTSTTLRDEIRLERTREFLGEGFRMSDLRRWHLGFSRSIDYPLNPGVAALVKPSSRVSYQPDDYRYVWPIPSTEIQVNPQMAGQQNRGY